MEIAVVDEENRLQTEAFLGWLYLLQAQGLDVSVGDFLYAKNWAFPFCRVTVLNIRLDQKNGRVALVIGQKTQVDSLGKASQNG